MALPAERPDACPAGTALAVRSRAVRCRSGRGALPEPPLIARAAGIRVSLAGQPTQIQIYLLA